MTEGVTTSQLNLTTSQKEQGDVTKGGGVADHLAAQEGTPILQVTSTSLSTGGASADPPAPRFAADVTGGEGSSEAFGRKVT